MIGSDIVLQEGERLISDWSPLGSFTLWQSRESAWDIYITE